VQATLEKPDQISTMPTCGDNAETDLRVLAGGRIAEPQLQSGHADRRNQCLSGVKRTWLIALHMSAYDPKADIAYEEVTDKLVAAFFTEMFWRDFSGTR
jgi:hypothetical protein